MRIGRIERQTYDCPITCSCSMVSFHLDRSSHVHPLWVVTLFFLSQGRMKGLPWKGTYRYLTLPRYVADATHTLPLEDASRSGRLYECSHRQNHKISNHYFFLESNLFAPALRIPIGMHRQCSSETVRVPRNLPR